MVVETNGDSVHVHGEGDPWTIDGWVASKDFVPNQDGQVFGIIAALDGAPHKVVSEARVSAGTLAQTTPFTLEPGAIVLVTKKADASCFVHIPNLESTASTTLFVVDCGVLQPVAATRH